MINIQNEFVIHSGATIYGHATLYFWGGITKLDQVIIGEGGLIVLEEGATITSTYDSNKYLVDTNEGNNINEDIGKTTLSISGGATAKYMEFLFDISTKDVYFAIPYNFDIVLENGHYEFANPYKLLPGASLWVKNDATLEVTSGLYVYDGLVQSDMSGKSYPTSSLLQDFEFSASANFIVDGNLIVRNDASFGGIIQTNGGGSITIEDNAIINNHEVIDGGVGQYDVNTSKFALTARVYDSNSNKLVTIETGKSYLGDTTFKEWTLESYTATYAINASLDDYSEDIPVIDGKYHKWLTETVTINESMIGAWKVQ